MSNENTSSVVPNNELYGSVANEINLEKIVTRPLSESIEASTIALHTRCLSAIPVDLEEILKELESK
jgi:phosphate uptake regulator